jgi:hypothetical protein|tara:strand:- start:1028 stop:1249 length:222 start_codon:yes stop_codon:yes gene_type:complete
LQEAITPSSQTLEDSDPMLNIWGLSGYRLNNILADRKHRKLLYALDDTDIVFQAAHIYVHQQSSLKISCQVDQ